ncbi:DUF2934 domain-containing protein [Insolitispirillum peregrinum]|uniref:DUF2934 domain-containing protein n=1 Tax=Insolitispirillum peregrinum TaxID=80876 RepID=UPI003613C787
MSTLPHHQVSERAYHLWQAEGCQPGDDLRYWLRAEAELRAEHSPAKAPVKTASPRKKAAAKPKSPPRKKGSATTSPASPT